MTGSGIHTVAVIGAGVMGCGIAQLALQSGFAVTLTDQSAEMRDTAAAEIRSRLSRLVEKGKLPATLAEKADRDLRLTGSLSDLADSDLVVEAITERLDIKRDLIADLERHVPQTTLIATNTSSFLVSEVAARAKHSNRVAGLHFFNPAPLMRLVEVISSVHTGPEVSERLIQFCNELERIPIRAADTNGFIVNRLGRGYVLEAARAAEEGLADFATIDRIMTSAYGFRMGPFELMDLTGLDVTYPASRAIWEGNGFDSRLTPPALMQRRFKAGLLGKKVGHGFRTQPAAAPNDPEDQPKQLRVFAQTPAIETRARANGLTLAASSQEADVTLLPADGRSLAVQGAETCALVDCEGLDQEAMALTSSATEITGSNFRALTLQSDSAGTIGQRIALQLALIASDMVQQGVASVSDIDTAARLGLGHPEGPFERIERIGAARLDQVRAAIFAETGEDRFRPSPWLSRQAQKAQA